MTRSIRPGDLMILSRTSGRPEKLRPKYALIRKLLSARKQSGMTREAAAHKIGTMKSAISRLEAGSTNAPSVRNFSNKLPISINRRFIEPLTRPFV
ncbi:MAG: helix-turn-helix transcriptional regulator [Chlorobiaceae bacterium]|nr:helix-turn-helix transcriptional regulator [Chlorobiaceae bacterium]